MTQGLLLLSSASGQVAVLVATHDARIAQLADDVFDLTDGAITVV